MITVSLYRDLVQTCYSMTMPLSVKKMFHEEKALIVATHYSTMEFLYSHIPAFGRWGSMILEA